MITLNRLRDNWFRYAVTVAAHTAICLVLIAAGVLIATDYSALKFRGSEFFHRFSLDVLRGFIPKDQQEVDRYIQARPLRVNKTHILFNDGPFWHRMKVAYVMYNVHVSVDDMDAFIMHLEQGFGRVLSQYEGKIVKTDDHIETGTDNLIQGGRIDINYTIDDGQGSSNYGYFLIRLLKVRDMTFSLICAILESDD
jgi:hypothetical protein